MSSNRESRNSLHGAAPDRSTVALLVLDMVSDFAFEQGAAIARAAVPVIFVNDNPRRWRSDFPGLVRHCSRAGSRGAAVLSVLAPQPRDCVASGTVAQRRLAAQYFRSVLGADLRPSPTVRFPRRRRGPGRQP